MDCGSGALVVQQVQEDSCPVREEEVVVRGTAPFGGRHHCLQKIRCYLRISSKFLDEVRLKIQAIKNRVNEIFRDTGLQKRQIQNIISTVPPSQWDVRIQKARNRTESKGKKKLKLVNHILTNVMMSRENMEKNKIGAFDPEGDGDFFYRIDTGKKSRIFLETGDVLSFLDIVTLSAFYSLIEAGYKVITIKDIWEVTHFTGKWDNVKPKDKVAFTMKIGNAITRLKKRHIMTRNYDANWNCTQKEYSSFGESFFLGKYEVPEHEHINTDDVVSLINAVSYSIKEVPDFYKMCKKIRGGFTSFHNKMLPSKNCKIDWLEKIYIARKIVLSANQDNKIYPSMLWETAAADLGRPIDREKARGYMRFLKKNAIIEDFKFTALKLEWKTALPEVTDDDKELVVLRDENEKEITADQKPEKIKRVEAELKAYNGFLENRKVVLDGQELDCKLRAVYSRGSYDMGGRLYTSKNGHQVEKSKRKRITINGNATIEMDFCCYHTNMLYNTLGFTLDGDAYDFLADRQKAKRVLNTCLDARDEKQAKCSIASFLCYGDDYKGDRVYDVFKKYIPEAEEMMRKAEERHSCIKDKFYTDNSLALQNLDAQIMLEIIDTLRRKKILALPIHDSIIVEVKNLMKAKKTMGDVYKAHMKHDCRIKIE